MKYFFLCDWLCFIVPFPFFGNLLLQVFLHLATLDNSVTWSRSLTKTRCRVCRKGGDHEKMLLCDGCDKGHHIYCLKPKLKSIPEGDWFCDKCKPKLKPKSPAKKRKVYVEEEMEEEEVNEEEQQPEEEEEEEEERGAEEEEEIFEDDYCDVCSTGGELLCCDGCPRTFHVECVGLRKIPRGNWLCQHCTESKNATKEEKTKKEEKSKRTSEGARGVKRKAAANLRGKKQVTYAEEEEENDSAESEEELQPSRKRKKTARYGRTSHLVFFFFFFFYASPSSGDAYSDRQLTTNFELPVGIFCVPDMFPCEDSKFLSVRP